MLDASVMAQLEGVAEQRMGVASARYAYRSRNGSPI